MKRYTILGLFALVCVASLAYADNCGVTYSNAGPFVAGGVGTVVGNLATYCGNVVPGSPGNTQPLLTDPTQQRTDFLNNSGQAYLDTINWEVNQADCGGGSVYYCFNPEYYDDQQGSGIPPYPSPPYGGGTLGTGYSWGDTGNASVVGTNPLDVGVVQSSGTLPSNYDSTNILTGLLGSTSNLALTWDTSTTGATYVTDGGTLEGNPGGYYASNCNPPSGYDPNCWLPGTNSNAAITGVGFDVQLIGNGSIGPFTMTFAIYGATPNCNTSNVDGNSAIISGTLLPEIDCFDYTQTQGQMTDASGNDVPSDCNSTTYPNPPIGHDPNDPGNCNDYTDSSVQLLGTITINSDSNGDPVFFGFTTTDPYGVGAIVQLGGGPLAGGEFDTANFSIDEQTLLTQEQAATPEPATLLLFGSGLLIAARRLRKSATK